MYELIKINAYLGVHVTAGDGEGCEPIGTTGVAVVVDAPAPIGITGVEKGLIVVCLVGVGEGVFKVVEELFTKEKDFFVGEGFSVEVDFFTDVELASFEDVVETLSWIQTR